MKWKVVEMSLTLQEQLAGISKEIFRENNSIDAKHINNKMSKEDKEHRVKTLCGDYVHSNINSEIAINNEINYNRVFENNEIDLRDIKRGNIVWINLFGSVGSEQGSTEHGRPCVCIQNNMGNTHSPTIIVACITSQINKSRLPIHVEIPASEKYGLTKDSVVLLEQIRTVDKRKRILRKTGHLDENIMKQIDRGLKISIFEPEEKTSLEKLPKNIQNEINETLQYIYSYEKVLGKSQSDNLNHLISERRMLLEHLEDICNKNNINYRDYYIPYTKERKVNVG
jgi:mRNA interferase MazF